MVFICGLQLIRFHGVFTPNSKCCTDVTPAKRTKSGPGAEDVDKTPDPPHQAMTWAQRLKRVFNIDVSACPKCGGEAKVITSIEDPPTIDMILQHLQAKGTLPLPVIRIGYLY